MKKVIKALGFGLAVYGTASLVKYEATKYWEKEGPVVKAKVQRYFVDSMYDSITKKINDEMTTALDLSYKSTKNNYGRYCKSVKDHLTADSNSFIFHFKTVSQLTFFVRRLNHYLIDYAEISSKEIADIYEEYGDSSFIDADLKKLRDMNCVLTDMPDFEATKNCIDDCWQLEFTYFEYVPGKV